MGMLSDKQVTAMFGTFTYKDNPDGSIVIDPKWVASNIATIHTVVIPTIRCHVKVAKQLSAALSKIHMQGLGKMIKTYDGAWYGRHRRWDKRAGLSRHSWGVCIDLNYGSNPMGKYNYEMEPLAAIFSEMGWLWGNTWSPEKYADPTHFEIFDLWN